MHPIFRWSSQQRCAQLARREAFPVYRQRSRATAVRKSNVTWSQTFLHLRQTFEWVGGSDEQNEGGKKEAKNTNEYRKKRSKKMEHVTLSHYKSGHCIASIQHLIFPPTRLFFRLSIEEWLWNVEQNRKETFHLLIPTGEFKSDAMCARCRFGNERYRRKFIDLFVISCRLSLAILGILSSSSFPSSSLYFACLLFFSFRESLKACDSERRRTVRRPPGVGWWQPIHSFFRPQVWLVINSSSLCATLSTVLSHNYSLFFPLIRSL